MTSKIESAVFSVAQKIEEYGKKHDSRPETASEESSSDDNDARNDAQFDAGERQLHDTTLDKENGKGSDDDSKGPKGGFDDTPVPEAPLGYTVKFTFHRATNLPMADINSFSSDPYIVAQLYTGLQQRHKEDPPLRLRTPTIRRDTEPVWNTEWVVANVPASGFKLKCRIYDEDPADHDDRLGNATIEVQGINDMWPGIQEQAYKIKKRMGSKRAYLMRGLAVALRKTKHMYGSLFLSVEILGKTEGDNGGRCYTIGPMWYTKHYSPMLGRIANRKEPEDNSPGTDRKAQKYNFQANQFQMQGPVPAELYHRFVEFKPFVKRMFTSTGVQGYLLSKALHHQHARVYNYDRTTEYGAFKDAPSEESTLKFLDLVHWDQGGRIYTYVLTLDSLFRFTETGKEFGIDFLSKHTMHSDVNIYIAYSGEFFVRRLKHKNKPTPEEHLHSPDSKTEGGESSEHQEEIPKSPSDQTEEHPPKDLDGEPPKDPQYYELVIDNDSGTYRPNAKLLPILKEYLQHQLPGMHIVTLDCQEDAELQQKMKSEQRAKKQEEGDHILYRQASRSSSISSSDLSDLDDMEEQEAKDRGTWKAMGKDAKLKGKARGKRWRGLVQGRDGVPEPNANGEGGEKVEDASQGVDKLAIGHDETNGAKKDVGGDQADKPVVTAT